MYDTRSWKQQYDDELKEIYREILIQDVIINDGNIVLEGLKSDFWKIFQRTIQALQESYKQEAYDASKDNNKNTGAYLGRMEMVDHITRIMNENFIQNREGALLKKEALIKRTLEIQDILDSKETLGYTGGNSES